VQQELKWDTSRRLLLEAYRRLTGAALPEIGIEEQGKAA